MPTKEELSDKGNAFWYGLREELYDAVAKFETTMKKFKLPRRFHSSASFKQ